MAAEASFERGGKEHDGAGKAWLISAEVAVDVERGTSGTRSVSRWLLLVAATSACRRHPGAPGVGRDGLKEIGSRSCRGLWLQFGYLPCSKALEEES